MLRKNRLTLEEVPGRETGSGSGAPEGGQRVYLDDTPPPRRHNPFVRILPWVALVAVVAGITIYAWYRHNQKNTPGLLGLPETKELDQSQALQKGGGILLPGAPDHPALKKAVRLYNEGKYNQAETGFQQVLQAETDHKILFQAWMYRGAMDFDRARYSRAIQHFRQATKLNEKSWMAWSNLARAYRMLGYTEEALKAARKARSLKPAALDSSLLLGNIRQEQGDLDSSLRAFQDGLKENPNNPKLLYNSALTLLKQGKSVPAAEEFKKAIRAAPDSRIAVLSHSQLGALYLDRGRVEDALYHYQVGHRLDPKNPRFLYNLGIVAWQKKQTDNARDYFRRALSARRVNDPALYRHLGEALAETRDYALADRAYSVALDINPRDLESLFGLGELTWQRGNLQKAEDVYRDIVRLTPGNHDTVTALNNLGIILDEQRRFQEAREAYQQALKIEPENETTLYNLGLVYRHANQTGQTLQVWRGALQRNPGSQKIRRALADQYYKNGWYEDALREYNRLARGLSGRQGAEQTLAAIHLRKGIIYRRMKSWNEARGALEKSAQLAKEAPAARQQALLELALTNVEAEDFRPEEARRQAFEAIHLNPDNARAKMKLARVLLATNSATDREQAIQELTALTLSGEKPELISEAFNLLGLLYYKNGETRRALIAFQNALDLDPSNRDAFRNQRLVRSKIN